MAAHQKACGQINQYIKEEIVVLVPLDRFSYFANAYSKYLGFSDKT